MKTVILGAGNLLLTDEGFGVHFVRYLMDNYHIHEDIELVDGGTLGIMLSHKFEDADRAFIVDVIDCDGDPGEIHIYEKEEILLNKLPVKMSPHQIGIQEMLALSDLRGKLPEKVTLYGVIPANYDAGTNLSPELEKSLAIVAKMIEEHIKREGGKLSLKA